MEEPLGDKRDSNRNDQRIQRTRKNIKDSFLLLLGSKSFDSLTVNDISEKAMINRTTFYRHFPDKYALTMEILQEAMEDLMKNVGSVEENMLTFSNKPDFANKSDPLLQKNLNLLSAFFEYFNKNRSIFKPLLGENGSLWFISKMNTYLSDFWIKRLKSDNTLYKKTSQNGILSIDIASVWLAHSVVSILGWWLEKGSAITSEAMAEYVLSVIVQGYYSSLGLEPNR